MTSLEKEKMLLSMVGGQRELISVFAKRAKTTLNEILLIAKALGCFRVSVDKMGRYVLTKSN